MELAITDRAPNRTPARYRVRFRVRFALWLFFVVCCGAVIVAGTSSIGGCGLDQADSAIASAETRAADLRKDAAAARAKGDDATATLAENAAAKIEASVAEARKALDKATKPPAPEDAGWLGVLVPGGMGGLGGYLSGLAWNAVRLRRALAEIKKLKGITDSSARPVVG